MELLEVHSQGEEECGSRPEIKSVDVTRGKRCGNGEKRSSKRLLQSTRSKDVAELDRDARI